MRSRLFQCLEPGFFVRLSCSCTTAFSVRFCMNPLVGSHWVSPKQGKMSLGWWAPVRDSSSEPCAREATQKSSKRITSTWASAAVWLIDSSRFPLNMKYDQEEKLREAPTAEPVCTRHCCWGFSRSPASSLCVVCRDTQPWCPWEQRLVTLEGVCTKYIASGKSWARTQHFQKNSSTAWLPSLTIHYGKSFVPFSTWNYTLCIIP